MSNSRRIAETTFSTYELARKAKDGTGKTLDGQDVERVKIFARNNGTFTVVWFNKEVPKEEIKKVEKKDRKKPAEKNKGKK